MANVIKEQKIIDNNRRALIKYVFVSDGTAEANTVLVDVSMLSQAMNANNKLMVSNTHPKAIYRTTIKRIFGDVRANSYIALQWHGAVTNNEIVLLTSGQHDINFDAAGEQATIPNPLTDDSANSRGDIVLSVPGPRSGDSFTLFIDLRKDTRDFNTGQLSDPTAFNYGN